MRWRRSRQEVKCAKLPAGRCHVNNHEAKSGFGAPVRCASRVKRNEEMVIVERSSGMSRSGPRRIVMRMAFGLALALTIFSARADPLPRTILFLDEDTPIYPWFRQMSEAFYATIRTETADPPFVFIENLGIDAYGTASYFDILRSHFREKYHGRPIGVIISNAS